MPRDQELKNTVTAQDINDFDPEIAECCTADNFRIHLAGSPGEPWNKSAARVLVNNFLETHEEYEAQDDTIRAMVIKKCEAAVGSTIRKYKWKKKHRTKDSRALARENKNRAERKRTVRTQDVFLCAPDDQLIVHLQLFHRRRDLTFLYPALRPQREKLDLLGVAGMSSDEEEKVGTMKQWRILLPRWRSMRVTGWLRYFDAIYDKTRNEGGAHDSRGQLPRHRASARRTSQSKKYVPRLPRNAYRKTWLNSLVDVDNVVRPTANVQWTHDPVITEYVCS